MMAASWRDFDILEIIYSAKSNENMVRLNSLKAYANEL
jgi:hypothetical protein